MVLKVLEYVHCPRLYELLDVAVLPLISVVENITQERSKRECMLVWSD